GGKGLHVVTPLAPAEISWPEAKGFARKLCCQMAADSPERFLVEMNKKARAARIYLDYLRNDLTSSAVAPLSPRARDGAPVSMPLLWSQVRNGLDPRRFTLRSAPRLIAKIKPWRDYFETERPLSAAIKRLGKAKGG
ncbi:MAG: DNA ligase D, partial [Candidatus Binataceae bacterium]